MKIDWKKLWQKIVEWWNATAPQEPDGGDEPTAPPTDEPTDIPDQDEPVSTLPAWDKCTRASCWDGDNAQKRMMNILSPRMSEDKFDSYLDWMLSIGCNTAHVALSNEGDGEAAGYCIYGSTWSWKVDNEVVFIFKRRIADLRKHGFGVVAWLFMDDSRTFNKTAAGDFGRYLRDLKAAGLLDDVSTVVAGLELNEYYSAENVRQLIGAIREAYSGKIGTHQTSGKYDFAKLADICFYQIKPGASAATVKSEAQKVIKATGKPLNFFELDRNPNRTLCDAAFAGGAFAVGNWQGKPDESSGGTDNIPPTTGNIDPAQVKWLGTNYAKAKVTRTITSASISGNHLNFKLAAPLGWPKCGPKNVDGMGFLIRKINGQYVGGKVEWCVSSRGWYDIKTNVKDGYNGSTMPNNGETVWCGIGHPSSQTECTNLVPVVWK